MSVPGMKYNNDPYKWMLSAHTLSKRKKETKKKKSIDKFPEKKNIEKATNKAEKNIY